MHMSCASRMCPHVEHMEAPVVRSVEVAYGWWGREEASGGHRTRGGGKRGLVRTGRGRTLCCSAGAGLGWWGGRAAEASMKYACAEAAKGRPHIKSGHICNLYLARCNIRLGGLDIYFSEASSVQTCGHGRPPVASAQMWPL